MKRPFKEYYSGEDITMCNNSNCKDRHTCYRYMARRTSFQSMFMSKTAKSKEDYNSYTELIVWTDARGKQYTLDEISDSHLLNIIIHLFERNNCNSQDVRLAKEFIKEARRRHIYN